MTVVIVCEGAETYRFNDFRLQTEPKRVKAILSVHLLAKDIVSKLHYASHFSVKVVVTSASESVCAIIHPQPHRSGSSIEFHSVYQL